MVAFPDILTGVVPIHPWSEGLEFKTLITPFENGKENRKQKRLFVRRNFSLKYKWITKANGQILYQFYLDRKGSFEAFNLFAPWSNTYEGEYVGAGDGSTTIFNMPSKSASSSTLYVNGVAKTGGGVDYTFTSQGGADNADKVEFVSAPADGEKITWDFTGLLKIRCRFGVDKMDFETFFNALVNTGIPIQGLLNA